MIIGGGYDSTYLNSVETLDTWSLPNLPYSLFGTTLTAVGSLIYHCGGYRSSGSSRTTTYCYKLNIQDSSPRWSSTTYLPKGMYHHTAVAVSSHIWFTYYSFLYDLDTQTSRFRSYRLPFHLSRCHCAVSNSTHSYVIAVGSHSDEVWVNKSPKDPSKWIKVAKLAFGRQYIACLLHDGTIYVTGGYVAGLPYKGVEVIDTKNYKVWKTGDMITGRRYHEMMVLEGSPTVVGGYGKDNNGNSINLANIEVYNTTTFTWHLSTRSLQQKRREFALAQL